MAGAKRVMILLGWIPMLLGTVGVIYAGIYYRFKCPELTETQLFLENWDLILLSALFIFVSQVTFMAQWKK